jgi:hypothetical protein
MKNKKNILIASLIAVIALASFGFFKYRENQALCDKINAEGIPVKSAIDSGTQAQYAEKMQSYNKKVSEKIQEQVKNGARISDNYNYPEQVREITRVNEKQLAQYSTVAKLNEVKCEGLGEKTITVKYATNLTLQNPDFSSRQIGTQLEKKKEVNYKYNISFENDEEASMYMLTLLATINETYMKEIK